MMRRLVQRHRGILPLDTVESIWRVIIATFTYVQAPFSAHADLSAGDALMRNSARFHFGFTVPLLPYVGAASVVAAVTEIKRRSRPGSSVCHRRRRCRTVVDDARIRERAENHRAVAVRRARRSPGRPARVCDFARSARGHGDRNRGLELSRLWLERGVRRQSRRACRRHSGSRQRARRRRLAHFRHRRRCRRGRQCSGSVPAPRSVREPSSAATRPAIRCRRKADFLPACGWRKVRTREMSVYPQPRPGVLEIEPYVPGKSSAPGRRQDIQAVVQRDAARAQSARDSRVPEPWARVWKTIRTAPRRCCAKRSDAHSGSIQAASSAAPAPTIC